MSVVEKRRSGELTAAYAWLIEKLKAELPDLAVTGCEMDLGHVYCVGALKGEGDNRRRHAVRVEYEYAAGNSPGGYLGKTWANYSLNEDPTKDTRVAEIIKTFRAL